MNKKVAHILFIAFDIFAILCFWNGCMEIQHVFKDISNSFASISFLNRVGFLVIMPAIPAFHIYAIFEYFQPSLIQKWQDRINYIIIVISITLLVIAIFISFGMKSFIENKGYMYCENASSSGIIARTLVYTKDRETCDKLGAERREKLGLPPRK